MVRFYCRNGDTYKIRKEGRKMKRYYHFEEQGYLRERDLLVVDSEDIVEKVYIDRMYGVLKSRLYEEPMDLGYYDEAIYVEDAKGIVFLEEELLISRDNDTVIDIFEKMGRTVEDMDTHLVTEQYVEGQWKEYELSGDWCEWIDMTDDLEGMTVIDDELVTLGYYTLYQLQDGRKALVYDSFENKLSEITYFEEPITTIDAAVEIIKERI